MKKLQCTNKDCDSRTNDDPPMFMVNLTVGEDGSPVESAIHIEGQYFVCCHCQSKAEWVENNE